MLTVFVIHSLVRLDWPAGIDSVPMRNPGSPMWSRSPTMMRSSTLKASEVIFRAGRCCCTKPLCMGSSPESADHSGCRTIHLMTCTCRGRSGGPIAALHRKRSERSSLRCLRMGSGMVSVLFPCIRGCVLVTVAHCVRRKSKTDSFAGGCGNLHVTARNR